MFDPGLTPEAEQILMQPTPMAAEIAHQVLVELRKMRDCIDGLCVTVDEIKVTVEEMHRKLP